MVIRKCHFCSTDFETSFRNHGTLYKTEKIFICSNCLNIDVKCDICGRTFQMRITKHEPNKIKLCSHACSRKHAVRAMSKSERFGREKYCDTCGQVTKRYKNGACLKCVTRNARSGDYNDFCESCNKETPHYSSGRCITCVSKVNIQKALKAAHKPEAIAKREATMRQNGEAERRLERIHSKEVLERKRESGFFERLILSAHTPEANKKREEALMKSGEADKRNERIREFTSDPKHQAKAARAMIDQCKEACEGIFSEESKEKSIEHQVKNQIGIFDPEIRKEIIENQIQNLVGIFDPEVRKANIQHQKENKLGIFDPEIAAKGRERALQNKIDRIKESIKNSGITVQFEDLEEFEIGEFDYGSFSSLDGVPGVWAIFGESGGNRQCLDVCQTSDIGNEMRLGYRKLSALTVPKYKEFVKYETIVFKVVALGIEFEKDRELIEAVYAVQNESLFWNPAPNQKIPDEIKGTQYFGQK